jgi:hypothetical protein
MSMGNRLSAEIQDDLDLPTRFVHSGYVERNNAGAIYCRGGILRIAITLKTSVVYY